MDRVQMRPAWSFECPDCGETTYLDAPIATGPDGEEMMAVDDVVECGHCGEEWKPEYHFDDESEDHLGDESECN